MFKIQKHSLLNLILSAPPAIHRVLNVEHISADLGSLVVLAPNVMWPINDTIFCEALLITLMMMMMIVPCSTVPLLLILPVLP